MKYEIKVIPPFEKAVRALAKKYHKIKQNIIEAVKEIEENPYHGVAIVGYEGHVWKLRVANTSSKRGKQGGFRIIYLLEESSACCYFLTIYSKTEKEDITKEEIDLLLQSMEKQYFSK